MKLVDRLEKAIESLKMAGCQEDGTNIKSIREAIARIGPYEPGEIVEVSNYADFNIKIRGGYIGALYEGVVVERGDDNSIEYFPYHRPLQKYVNVKLPLEIINKAKKMVDAKPGSIVYEAEVLVCCKAIVDGAEK